MLRRTWTAISLGERYVLASLVYIGLGLFLGNVMPAVPVMAYDSENPCLTGYVCCEDGSSGPAASCLCCSPGEGFPTTVFCE